MKELIEAVQAAANVKEVTFIKKTKQWKIVYAKGSLTPDYISTDLLIDFLNNA